MTGRADKLSRLARLAKIRSDMELKRFAAFRLQVETISAEKEAQRKRLAGSFAQPEAFTIAEARLANLEAGALARDIARLDDDLRRMKPGFDAARSAALREFGRVQALQKLSRRAREARRQKGPG